MLRCPPNSPGTVLPSLFSLAHSFSFFSTNIFHQELNMYNLSSLKNTLFLFPCFCLTSLFGFPFSLPAQPSFLKECSTLAVYVACLPTQSSITHCNLVSVPIIKCPDKSHSRQPYSRSSWCFFLWSDSISLERWYCCTAPSREPLPRRL